MALEAGQVYEATLDVKNTAGVLANPATAVLTITDLTDGTTTSPAVTLPPAVTGHLIYDHLAVKPGMLKFRWVTTAPGTSKTDYVTVRDFISLISVQEAKDHLNFRAGTDSDEELSRMMQASTELVEARGGYTIRRQVTDEIDAPEGTFGLALPRYPVLSVQSVTSQQAGGPAWVTADIRLDSAGIIWLVTRAPFWQGPWAVAYTVGRTVPLEKHLQADREQLRHLWETQHGPSARPSMGGEDTFTTSGGFTFSVPSRVMELLRDEMIPAI